MKLRWLAIMPLLVAMVVVVLDLILASSPAYPIFKRAQLEAVRLACIIGMLAAALKFRRGEYLRKAWMLLSINMMVFLLRDVLFIVQELGIDLFGNENNYNIFSGIMVVIGNVFGVIGMFVLARAWKVADLELPGPKWGQQALFVIAVLLSFIIVGPTAYKHLFLLLEGSTRSMIGLGSSLGDIISLCLIAPLLLTALALRGGLLVWPWLLITASSISWLFYDATAFLEASTTSIPKLIVYEAFRTLACMFGFAAALAQRFVVDKIRKDLG